MEHYLCKFITHISGLASFGCTISLLLTPTARSVVSNTIDWMEEDAGKCPHPKNSITELLDCYHTSHILALRSCTFTMIDNYVFGLYRYFKINGLYMPSCNSGVFLWCSISSPWAFLRLSLSQLVLDFWKSGLSDALRCYGCKWQVAVWIISCGSQPPILFGSVDHILENLCSQPYTCFAWINKVVEWSSTRGTTPAICCLKVVLQFGNAVRLLLFGAW